jgi:hypothetical protein
VINAVPAARKAVPDLGRKWVAIGHSQGAAAVLYVAELQSEVKDPSYLGAVELAPGTDRLVLFHMTSKNAATHGYLAFQAYGIKAIYPKFQYSDFLTPEALKFMPVVKEGGWYVTLATFAQEVPVGKMVKPGAEKNVHFMKFRDMNVIGLKRGHRRIFLAAGTKDTTIPLPTIQDAKKRMEDKCTNVDYKEYDGLDHDSLVFGSFRDQVQWVRDRFDGKLTATKADKK